MKIYSWGGPRNVLDVMKMHDLWGNSCRPHCTFFFFFFFLSFSHLFFPSFVFLSHPSCSLPSSSGISSTVGSLGQPWLISGTWSSSTWCSPHSLSSSPAPWTKMCQQKRCRSCRSSTMNGQKLRGYMLIGQNIITPSVNCVNWIIIGAKRLLKV